MKKQKSWLQRLAKWLHMSPQFLVAVGALGIATLAGYGIGINHPVDAARGFGGSIVVPTPSVTMPTPALPVDTSTVTAPAPAPQRGPDPSPFQPVQNGTQRGPDPTPFQPQQTPDAQRGPDPSPFQPTQNGTQRGPDPTPFVPPQAVTPAPPNVNQTSPLQNWYKNIPTPVWCANYNAVPQKNQPCCDGLTLQRGRCMAPANKLLIYVDQSPASSIVIAGKDSWTPFSQYKVINTTGKTQYITSADVAQTDPNGDDADFAAVAVAQNGVVKGQDVLPSGATGAKNVDLSANPIKVAPNSSLDFQIWGKLAPVLPGSVVNGQWHGISRSGHTPNLHLQDAYFKDDPNTAHAPSGNTQTSSMVIRKSELYVTKQKLASTTLANTDQDLIKFQVGADNAGSVALKQATFTLSKTQGLTLSNFKLRRGAIDMDLGQYAIFCADCLPPQNSGVNLQQQSLSADKTKVTVVVSFPYEESIFGSGNVYTLHASVSGAKAGSSVSVSFRHGLSSAPDTGFVADNTAFAPNTAQSPWIYTLDASQQSSGMGTEPADFLWSDNSELPHSTQLGKLGGSRDWTNDMYVTDLTTTQTLSL